MDVNYVELLSYQVSVGVQIIYNRKNECYLIINKYLNKTLTLLKSRVQVLEMEKEDRTKEDIIVRNRQELEVFYFAEDLEKFFELINRILDLCEDYYIIEPMPET